MPANAVCRDMAEFVDKDSDDQGDAKLPAVKIHRRRHRKPAQTQRIGVIADDLKATSGANETATQDQKCSAKQAQRQDGFKQ